MLTKALWLLVLIGYLGPLFGQGLDVLQHHLDSLDLQQQRFAREGDFQQAALALKAYNDLAFRWQALSDSLKLESVKQTHQLAIRAQEIVLEETKLANQQRMIGLSLGLILLLACSFWLIRNRIRTNIRHRANQFQARLLHVQAENQLKVEKLQQSEGERERLQQKIHLKNQRLSSQLFHLLNQNQLLLRLQNKAKDLEGQGDLLALMKAEIQSEIVPEEDWKAFLQQFESVYPNFFSLLRQQNPQLTENDLKLCVLIRLQLSGKEMAQIMNQSSDSIKTTRYRLAQKLDLPKGQKLGDFLIQLG